jgi:hypothetical protein
MYRVIYYYYKTFLDSFNNKDHRSDVVLIIFFYQLIHLLFIHEIVLKLFHISLLRPALGHDYGTNKLIWIPILFIYTYLLGWYFNHKWDKIKTKYSSRIFLKANNTMIITSIFILPLIGLIILFNL